MMTDEEEGMKYTALEESMRFDLRRRRADALTSAVLQELDLRGFPREIKREVYRALTDVFMREGVEVLSDYTRAEIGLPPRGPDGWTLEEMLALERVRLDAITRPMTMTMPLPTWEAIQKQKAAASPDEGTGG
jgi:hypothetical protein